MPWNMQDYPDSFKNFNEVERKKIIEIMNAMEASGYKEEDLIPIAIQQGKEWYEHASDKEIAAFKKQANPQKSDKHENDSANPDLMDEDVQVKFDHEYEQWQVITVKAKRAADTFDLKEDAMKRAKEIADNKGTKVITYTKDGKRQ
ncbi:hypothetical protein APT62_03315 [Aerococcus urinaeequi]|uniref:DUF2188 domain-containing protein n=1 Tax=Aerococcus urinaeequi TaxID=51665 RepID=UPI000744A9C9|nr:DUF2188 domain-containing protein [Aerococcus urinaeequi]ALZ87542.1 hypothetical protein APT62_03315 [Aerococcus urinaeequi]